MATAAGPKDSSSGQENQVWGCFAFWEGGGKGSGCGKGAAKILGFPGLRIEPYTDRSWELFCTSCVPSIRRSLFSSTSSQPSRLRPPFSIETDNTSRCCTYRSASGGLFPFILTRVYSPWLHPCFTDINTRWDMGSTTSLVAGRDRPNLVQKKHFASSL